jgi:hypothetical protein
MEVPDDWRESKANAKLPVAVDEPAAAPRTGKSIRKVARVIGLLIVAGLAWSAWAAFAFYDFRNGLQDADPVSLERRIDWSSVRQGLREDLQANPPAQSGGDRAIDALVSRQGIVNLLRTVKLDNRGWETAAATASGNGQPRVFGWHRIKYASFSATPFAFRVDISPDSDSVKRPLVLLFKWMGDWQLTRIFLPADAASGAPQTAQRPPPPTASAVSQPQAREPGTEQVELYEEDPSDPNGKRYTGSVVWRIEQVPPAASGGSELAVTAHISVPDRPLNMTMAIRRNLDKTLPASHTIEIKFDSKSNVASDDIQDVAGIMMKPTAEAAGQNLAGIRVKVNSNFFLIGLSAIELDLKQNMQFLRERPWIGIPFVYNNRSRALLAIEKGKTGEKSIADALTQWNTAVASEMKGKKP